MPTTSSILETKVTRMPAAAPHSTTSSPGTILLVDDEPGLRKLVKTMMELRGCRVLDAGNAEEAIAIFHANRHGIDVLLTDIRMPGLSGTELADRLQQEDPGLPVLFMTGYADEKLTGWRAASVLAKPFRPQELSARLASLLESAAFAYRPSAEKVVPVTDAALRT